MNNGPVAVVVSHPAHLLTVVGVLARRRPHVLILYRAGAGAGQEEAVCAALDRHNVAASITCFGVSEADSFEHALAGDFRLHAELGARLSDWLHTVRPRAVLGDAYEAYNMHHDVARLLIDRALRGTPGRVTNYEFPLSCRVDEPGAPVQYGVFPFGPFRSLRLSAEEAAVKFALVEEVGRHDPFVAGVAPLFANPGMEPFRAVPADRDYTAPPPGLARYYDEHGRKCVAAGLHSRAITFAEHFVPLVRALDRAPATRTA